MQLSPSGRAGSPAVYRDRTLAVVEVLAVFVLIRIVLVAWLLPLLGLPLQIERFLDYIVIIAVPLLVIRLRREAFETYGLGLRDFGQQARVALSLFIPFAIEGFLVGALLPMLIPGSAWARTAVDALIWIGVLFWSAYILNRSSRSGQQPPAALPALVLLPLAGILAPMTIGQRLTGFAFYLLFLGPGEEILYRGYVQSRLNGVFGRPRQMLGASWGWGLVIAAVLFGSMHLFNSYHPTLGQYGFDWAWAAGAAVAGVVFGWLRERTGSVVAPAILHGLPQAIAALFMSFG